MSGVTSGGARTYVQIGAKGDVHPFGTGVVLENFQRVADCDRALAQPWDQSVVV